MTEVERIVSPFRNSDEYNLVADKQLLRRIRTTAANGKFKGRIWTMFSDYDSKIKVFLFEINFLKVLIFMFLVILACYIPVNNGSKQHLV